MEPVNLERCLQLDGPLRPTFCNVPPWGEALVYIAGALAIAIFAWGIFRHWRLWLSGQGATPERNLGRPGQRLLVLLRYGFGQKATVERKFPGAFHSGMFYGFVLLFIGTALATLDWDVAKLLFERRILAGRFYLVYEAVLDAAGLVFLVGLFLAGVRRYVARPHHVLGAWDFMIWSLVLINASGFLVEGLRLVLAPVEHGVWSWVGYALAGLFRDMGMSIQTAAGLHLWLWIGHMLASLGFLAAIPFSNAVHMISTPANLTMKPLGAGGAIGAGAALQPVDIENADFYGAGRMSEFSWKQRLGFDACTRCGRCELVCPAYMSGTPLNPKAVIVSLSGALRTDTDRPFAVNGEGEVVVGEGLLVEPAALFACTTCMACVEACPALIEIVDDIVDMRRYLTLNEGALPGTSGDALRNMGAVGNPWGYAPEDRTKWSEGLDVEIAKPGQHYEVLYWVGCSGSYDQRNQKISRALARLMQRAGVRFAIMAEESCTCESARRLGEEYLYQTATKANVVNMEQYTFDRVVCHCPHCFNTMANEFPQFGGNYEVVHHTQLLRELIDSGRLSVPATARDRVVFHDSCYLGRYNREFEAPRASLRAAGVDVLEPERTREDGLCCGGGGGKMWFESSAERDVNLIRMEELLSTKPDAIGVACPFCLTMLDSARSTLDVQDVAVKDVAEVLADAVFGGGAAANGSD